MNWFEINKAHFSKDPFSDLHKWLHEAEIHTALNDMAGPTGVSRFLLFFRVERKSVVIEHIDSVPLLKGGGPPKNTSPAALDKVKQAILSFMRIVSQCPIHKGCLGFVRDDRNKYDLLAFFDDDVAPITLDMLPVPKRGYALEDPKYLRLLGSNELQLGQLIAQAARSVADWEEWSIEKETLILEYPQASTRQYTITVLGTFDWSGFMWNWQVDEPLFTEDAFTCREFLATWDQVMELGYLTTALLHGSWLFVGQLDESTVLLGCVHNPR